MTSGHQNQCRGSFRQVLLLALTSLMLAIARTAGAQAITNLHQLTQAFSFSPQISREVDLEVTVCAASRPKIGVLIVQDATGVELLQIGDFQQDIRPGELIRIRRKSCLLRKREMGVEISGLPIVFNDGLHAPIAEAGEVTLPAGKIPLQLEWFNFRRTFALEVTWAILNDRQQTIEASNLWHTATSESGATNFLPGLRAEYFEGTWDTLPDFSLLQPVKTGVETNFNLSLRSREERVGVRYSGYLEVPREGRYRFVVSSDDGAMLFLGDPNVSVSSLGYTNVPIARPSRLLEANFDNLDEHRWTVAEGRVSFAAKIDEGVRFDLGVDQHVISVRLADATELDLSALQNSRVRVTGIGRGVIAGDQALVFGELFAASPKDLVFVEPALGEGEPTLPITSVAQLRNLPAEEAQKALPVRIRGTVTGGIQTTREHWMSFQDDTRGIFVNLAGISNATPTFGELWEVEGHTGAGDFAPIIVADQLTRLGKGLFPSPVKPTWTELLNGSRDVQWAELKGLVTEVRSNTLSLHLPEGVFDVELEGLFESDLNPLLKSVVRIRGVLYAAWNARTREVRVGRVMMRNSVISVEVPAPTDPFDAVVKTPRELLLFDAQASPFRPVKVRGQILYVDPTQLFLEGNGAGLKLLPTARTDLHPGDLIEAVGFPDIGKTEVVLRDVLVKKTGEAPLPQPTDLDASARSPETRNWIRARVEGKLLGWHVEESGPVLEMQSGNRLYLARIASRRANVLTLRPGSRLTLDGVYVGRIHSPSSNADNESFELLLNSLADVTVLSEPPWWTLPRLLALLGLLLVILIFTVIWNTQLRQLVEQRTIQLQRETRERERIERQHALEAERSRIARDLHDDLGSSLTEISVLASTGQFPHTSAAGQTGLFQTIGTKARSLISALEVIVWAVDPEDNSLQSLADYLTGYTNEFFAHTPLACRFKVPVSFPPVTLEGRVRHDLLMAVKETLNNIVRHARATEVEFRMTVADGGLEIDVADNGRGIEKEAQNRGHGLKNLPTRLTNLGGSCTVAPRASGGTVVKIRLPLVVSPESGPVQMAKG